MGHAEPHTAICWVSRVQRELKHAGLRPTRQRLLLASLLFRGGDRHVTAEALHLEAERLGISVSLATVYNTLHQFTEAGLLRALAVEATKAYFDTNVSDHHHFFIEGENRIVDIPEGVVVGEVPPPDGMEIVNIDVVIRIRPKRDALRG
ncbi:iron response transcriptional regulator IrrA [Mesorhizobium sp. CAU 1732]|uniref:iron response transcriptional regulator IrrA n=1 Tax=Mesorhizobium sp. CAU 1732 TaxID=3140358 RepID=UPI00325FEAB4